MKTILALLVATTTTVIAQDNLGFVFAIGRHGARAPVGDDSLSAFGVPTGMLTPAGMRQRFMEGALEREKYINKY